MWVFCCGAKRSGSTLQYNIASKLIEVSGRGYRIPHRRPDEFPEILKTHGGDNRTKIFKTHKLTAAIGGVIAQGNAKALYCFRDVRDVVVSLINKGWIDRSENSIVATTEKYIDEYYEWMSVKDGLLIRKYEDFYDNLLEEVEIISNYLSIDVDSKVTSRIAEELDRDALMDYLNSGSFESSTQGNFNFDRRTLLHEKHIQGYKPKQFLTALTPREILLIEQHAAPWLTTNGYELVWPDTGKFISSSQHGDDYIAWQLLGRKKNGLVIEVGAFDGVHLSNSYSLSRIGWKSICIEPNPSIYPFLSNNRRDSVNLNYAVVGDPGCNVVNFFVERIGLLSGIRLDEDDLRNRYIKRGLPFEKPEEIVVPAATLNQIIGDKYSDIDIISIDVEGYELEVMRGIDLSKHRPSIFIIEANNEAAKVDLIAYFNTIEPRYVFIGKNYQNLFFQSEETFDARMFWKLDFVDFLHSQQRHPLDKKLSIPARKPSFIRNENLIKPKWDWKLILKGRIK